MRHKIILIELLLICLASCHYTRNYTEKSFLDYVNAGDKAYSQRNYPEAEKQYEAALNIAQKNGPESSDVIMVDCTLE
jgi:hypothetical protein